MEIKRKILLLFAGLALLYVMSLLFYKAYWNVEHQKVLESRLAILESTARAAFESEKSSQFKTVYDYTYWDELADFAQSGDTAWARENLVSVLESFGNEILWAFNLRQEMLIYRNVNKLSPDVIIPLPSEVFTILNENKFIQFFIARPEGVYLVSGGMIHRSNDKERRGTSYGYFLMADYLDERYLEKLNALTSSVTRIINPGETRELSDSRMAVFRLPLTTVNNSTVKEILFIKEFSLIDRFFQISRIYVPVYAVSSLLVILLIFFLIRKWVLQPLDQIKQGLVNENAAPLGVLKHKPDELGKVANLIDTFLSQKKELELSIDAHMRDRALLAESEEKFAKTFTFNPSPMFITTLKDWVILNANESFYRATGWTEQDITGRSLIQAGLFPDKAFLDGIGEALNKEEKVFTGETTFISGRGVEHFALLRTDFISFRGERCLLSVLVDITDRKKMEMAMQDAMQKITGSNRLKYDLLRNLSNEFRSPLTGITGFAEIIKEESQEKTITLLADRILQSGGRLLSTLNSIMLYAEIESGNLDVRRSRVELNDLVLSVVKDYIPSAAAKSLKIEYQSEERVILETDATLLKEMISRLLDNAVKFTVSGTITVSISKIKHDSTGQVSVRDTGIGIAEQHREKIFEEFTQLSGDIWNNLEGNGLGLTIVKALCGILGCRVSLSSVLSEGSVFTVSCPCLEEEP